MSTQTKTTTTHVLALPLPTQGHVLPFLETMQWLGPHGIKVTFVNSEVNHRKVLSGKHNIGDHIDLVSIPEGMEPWEVRNDFVKWSKAMEQAWPGMMEELIHKINESSENGNKITCLFADASFGWCMGLAKKLGLRGVAYSALPAIHVATMMEIPKLIQDGIIDENGTPQKMELVELSPNMHAINPSNFLWANFLDPVINQVVFKNLLSYIKDWELADRLICNSCYELEPAVFDLYPNITPIGPLLAENRLGETTGSFWKEDWTCIDWLNRQPPTSVIYISFGSLAVLNEIQFQELALGLEMLKMPFIWVLRPDMIDEFDQAFTKGFKERVGSQGRIIDWAPQQKVLSHPSISCFLSHCGWNSILEGLSNGVPFLCWPYYSDQPQNQSYICEFWKVGLGFHKDDSGFTRKEEVLKIIKKLLRDSSYKKKAMELKDMIAKSVSEGGISNKNLGNFIDWLKEA